MAEKKVRVIDSFTGPYEYLSNFYPCEVQFSGFHFKSAESAFQAMKVIDTHARAAFVPLNAWQAKKLGRRVQLRADWEEVKDDVMYQVLLSKFSGRLASRLRLTYDSELIERNHWGDRYWGVYKGEGLNKLGLLLMRVREEVSRAG